MKSCFISPQRLSTSLYLSFIKYHSPDVTKNHNTKSFSSAQVVVKYIASRICFHQSSVYIAQINVFIQAKKQFISSFNDFVVCVSEQNCVSIFFTRLWYVRKPLLFDTQNPRILRILNCACV